MLAEALVLVAMVPAATGRARAGGEDTRVPELIEQLAADDWTGRTNAAAMLGSLGPQGAAAVPLLVAHLRDPEAPPLYRSTATMALGMMGPAAHEAIPVLVEVFRTPHPPPDAGEDHLWEMARGNAAYALGQIGSREPAPVVEALLAGIPDVQGNVRDMALAALGNLEIPEQKREEAVPVLITVLSEWKAGVSGQAAAAELLGAMGPAASSAVPALTDALASRDDGVRRAAQAALEKIRPR